MTSAQTDAHWTGQGILYEVFCSHITETKDWQWGINELGAMKRIKVDPLTIQKCTEFLEDFLQERSEDEDVLSYQKEREDYYRETYFYPSEGITM